MMLLSWLNNFRPKAASVNGWLAFQLALFFLPSSAFLGGLFLLTSMIYGSRNATQPYFRDKWNWSFFIAGILMLVGSFGAYSNDLAWAGLGNWFPFFWAFWSLQSYLNTSDARRRAAYCLLAGSIPVVVTGLGQILLGWQGPWQLLGGLIIWHIDSGGEPIGRLSGLFDYANIAGAWLVCVWPLSMATLIQPNLKIYRRIFILILTFALVKALILTDSRNAWGGLILAIPFVIGPSSWFWLMPLLIILLMPVLLAVAPGVPLGLQQWARMFVPEGLWSRLNDMRYIERSIASTRLSQWKIALQLSIQRPIFGWGAAAFSVLYPLITGQWHGHAHNLPLDMAVSHGFPATILVVGTIITLLILSLRKVILISNQSYSQKHLFDRAWWTSCFILLVLHGTDMPFFDSRLNCLGWILLAGLRTMVD